MILSTLIHRSGRDLNSQFHEEFIGDALLAPRGILIRHPANQGLNLKRNRRSSRARLQPPEQFPSRSVPTKHRLGAHYDQSVPPVEEYESHASEIRVAGSIRRGLIS